jgi:ankyrin repeat protein
MEQMIAKAIGMVTPLYAACSNGHVVVVELPLKTGADATEELRYNSAHKTPLLAACKQGDTATVEWLLKAVADRENMSSINDQAPLYAACENGHLEIVKLLIIYGADVNKADKYGRTPLRVAHCCSCATVGGFLH